MPDEHLTYLLLELGWAIPVVALHWIRGWRMLWRARKALLVASLLPTLFLAVADSVALQETIWTLSPQKITGIYLANLPIEEIIFFLSTNLIIVQSILMLLSLQLRRGTAKQTEKSLAAKVSGPKI